MFFDYDGQLSLLQLFGMNCNKGALLLDSKRRQQLQNYLSTLLDIGLIILPYDQIAAEWFTEN